MAVVLPQEVRASVRTVDDTPIPAMTCAALLVAVGEDLVGGAFVDHRPAGAFAVQAWAVADLQPAHWIELLPEARLLPVTREIVALVRALICRIDIEAATAVAQARRDQRLRMEGAALVVRAMLRPGG